MKKILFSVFILGLGMINPCIAEEVDVFWLSQKGTPAQLKEAFANGANFNISRGVDEVADTDIHDLLFDSGETPLHHAASYNRNPESIKFLISLGLDVNAMAGSGQSVIENPLSCAIRNKNIEAAKELLKAGAEPNSYSSQGYSSAGSPLHIVAIEYKGNYKLAKDIIEALIQSGGDINNHSELTAEDIASLNEYEEEFAKYKAIFFPMNQWKSNNPFDNIRDFSSAATSNLLGTLTPLMYAVLCGNYDVIDILLDAGANANIRSAENKTALDYANDLSNNSKFNSPNVLKKLKTATTGSTMNTSVAVFPSNASDVKSFEYADRLVAEGKIPMYVRDKGRFFYNPEFDIVGTTGQKVKLRSQPNTKAKVVAQISMSDTGRWPIYLGEWTHPNGERWVLGEYHKNGLGSRGKGVPVWIYGKYADPMSEEMYAMILDAGIEADF